MYLTVCFIELACYGSRNNVPEQIIRLWNWRKFWLDLHWFWPVLHLTSSSFFFFLFFFKLHFLICIFLVFLCFVFLSLLAVFCYLCVEVGSLLAGFFYSFQATKKSLFRLYSMLHKEKQVIGICSASVEKCFFFFLFFFFINLFKTQSPSLYFFE